MLVVLLMLLGATLTMVRGNSQLTRGYHEQTAALYVAEAGVSDALARLKANRDWRTDLIDEPMSRGKGS